METGDGKVEGFAAVGLAAKVLAGGGGKKDFVRLGEVFAEFGGEVDLVAEDVVVGEEDGAEADADGGVDVVGNGGGVVVGGEGRVDLAGGAESLGDGAKGGQGVVGVEIEEVAAGGANLGGDGLAHLADEGEVMDDAVAANGDGEAGHVEDEDGAGLEETAVDLGVDGVVFGGGAIAAVEQAEEFGDRGLAGDGGAFGFHGWVR